MSENKKNVPKRRFKEFENAEDWEQHKLGELSDVYDGTHQTPKYTDNGGVMFLSVENIKTLQSEKYISKEAFEKEFKIFPEKGDILMTRIGDIGTANVVESNEPKAYYVSLALLKHKKLDPYFLKESISSETVKKEIWHRTLHIAFPKKINKNEIVNVSIPYPKFEEEQAKIGSFFKHINDLIALHQHKLDKMKALKKAYLMEMFPAEDEIKPKLRFAGFTHDWEQRKLGDITSYIKGFAFKSVDYKADGIRIIRVSDLSKDCVSEYVDKIYIDKNNAKQYLNYTINDGDIVITTVGSKAELKESAVGRPIIFTENKGYLLNQNLVKIAPIQNYDSQFIYNQLLSERYTKYIADIQRGNANQANITISDLWKYSLQCPTIEEQKKIGQFFNRLDNLITLHQRKLEKLQNIKKAYLNEMFI